MGSIDNILKGLNRFPKPVTFALLGAMGAIVGWLVGELILLPTHEQQAQSLVSFSPDMQARLNREGAEAGEIELALAWNNKNDLDLHCITPEGEHIYFGNKRSSHNGYLDVDMNRDQDDLSNKPTEHIRWRQDDALAGEYKVYIHYYQQRVPSDPIPYTLEMQWGDTSKTVRGELSYRDPVSTKTQQVMFKDGVLGEGLLLTWPDLDDLTKPHDLTLVHTFEFSPDPESRRNHNMTVVVALWTAVLAVGIGFGLVIGQNLILRRRLLSPREGGIVFVGSLVAGFISGGLGQGLFTFIANIDALAIVGQMMGWILLGGLLAVGMSLFIPNLKPLLAGIGGGLGGLVGAIAFLLASQMALGEVFGRLVGSIMLGIGIGAMIAVIEQLARSAYLRIHWGHGQWSNVSLGPTPVLIGSSTQAHVRVPSKSVADIAAGITFQNGRIELDDQVRGHKEILSSGQRLDYGPVVVEICSEDTPAEDVKVTSIEEPAETVASTLEQEPSGDSAASHPELERHESVSSSVAVPELTLVTETGKSIRVRITTRLNKHVLRECGPDAQFVDTTFQCELVHEDEGGWHVVHNPSATNETLLNGRRLTEAATLSNGDILSVGREAKGVSKVPLTIKL